MGGTITEPRPATKTAKVSDIEGSVMIVTRAGDEITLHRIDLSQPARFYMTYSDKPGTPVLHAADENGMEYYTEYTVLGDELAEGRLARFMTDDGYQEAFIITSLDVYPRLNTLPRFMRNGQCGFSSVYRGRAPRRTRHA